MGNQIIKQPNGLFAIFSSNTDTIHVWDATEEQVVDHFAELAEAYARTRAWVLMEHVRAGRPEDAYYQFAKTWEEVLELDQDNGGRVRFDYLADDGPSQRCSGCGRNTWSAAEFGKVCGMLQPSGSSCMGVFRASTEVEQEKP